MRLWPRFLTIPRAPDFTIWQGERVYLRRWWVIPRNRRFNIYLHNFLASDDDRALHDHPWWNISILLRGRYLEHVQGREMPVMRRPLRPVFRRAVAAHRVELIAGIPVWSLFITGPVVRQWGFHCPQGWRFWRDYVEERPGGNALGRGCE